MSSLLSFVPPLFIKPRVSVVLGQILYCVVCIILLYVRSECLDY